MKRESNAIRWPDLVLVGAAGFSAALGLAVLIGWHTRTVSLVQLVPGFVSMMYNTAVAFVLCGAGLLAAAYGRRRLAAAGGVLVATIGLLTLVEYLFGVDLGIDQLLITPYITVEASHPGRMAPNTAMSFALTGAALLVMSWPARLRQRPLVLALVGSLVVALGTLALVGYAVGLPAAYRWGPLTSMAVHTAAGLAVLGAGIVAFAWRDSQVDAPGAPRWLPILAGVGVLVITLGLWQALDAQNRAHLARTIRLAAAGVKDEITSQMDARVLALAGLAWHWEAWGKPPRDYWVAEAALSMRQHPGYQAVAWVDSSLRVRWVTPPAGHQAVQTLNLTVEKGPRGVLETVRDRREVLVTRPVDLGPGGKGFLVYVPIFHRDAFEGFVLGVFRFQPLLDGILSESVARGYSIALFHGAEELYRRGDASRQREDEWSQETDIDVYGTTWRVRVWPRPEWLAGAQVHVDRAVLLLGLVIALLLPWTIYLAQAARRRVVEAESARRTLEREQAHFRSLIEHALDIITVLDGDGTIRFESPSIEWVLGYKPEELIGRSLFEFVHPDDASAVIEAFTDAIQRPGIVPSIEFRFRHTDGSWRSLEAIGSNLLEESGVAGVVVNARDVTERRRAEEALRESERRFRGVFDGAGIGIALVGADGRPIGSNRALQTMLGFSGEELRRMAFTEFAHPDDVAVDTRLAEELFEGKRDQYRVEKRYCRKDGEVVWGHLTASLVRDAAGRPQFAVGMVENITERKQLEEQFRQAQKMEAVGRLAGGVAHDFNNLLTAIRGYSELLLTAPGADDGMRRDIGEIRKAAERATSLTRQLLAFSRRQVLEPQVLNFNTVVADVGKMLRRLIGEDVELATALDPAVGRVKADPGQLEQVLVNLAVNARDAMPQGGKLTIETANVELDQVYARRHVPAPPGSYVLLTVSDTGCGMDAETQARVFEPFFTTKEVGKGTGLGLSMAYGIVKQSGGYIWVYSEPGLGSTFKIYLPRVEEAAETAASSAPRAAPSGGSETILLVEDDEGVRTFARQILERAGYTLLEARDGNEALVIGERHAGPIALMLTDVVMPGKRGREVAQCLAAIRPDTRVLYMSGYTDNAIGNHGILDPGTAFLSKPFTADALMHKVREVLDAPGQVAAPPGALV
jgi:PAS domain S-box-containing protein